jgi:hypothetical protein
MSLHGAAFVVPLTSLVLILANASCTNAEDSTGTGGAANTGGAAAGTGGSSAGIGGTGGAGGSAGTATGGAAGGSGGSGGGAVGSGGAAAASGAGGAGGSGGSGGGSGFTLTSPDLSEGGAFADKYTCAAAGFNGSLSPELVWTQGPPGTKSYAITFIDVTLTRGSTPSDLGYHWVIYDIPETTLSLPEEFTDAMSIGAAQNNAYLGPCPNFGGGSETHTYEFKIYALDTETLSITPTTGTGAVKDAEAKLEANNLAVATLSGTSDASPP